MIRSGSIGILVASVLLSAWGCTGGGSTPAAPAPAPPTTDSLAITSGVDALRTGFFADYSLIATMSDRTTQTVTRQATWTTSDQSIATVDANGRLTAFSNGVVALSASYQGRTATRSVRIVFNYGGHWNGTYVSRACDQSGVFATSRYCQNLGSDPSNFGLELTQSGSNADEITGMISLRNLIGPVSGSVTSDGSLVLRASYVASSDGFNVRVDLPTWVTQPAGSLGMSGWFVHTLEVVGAAGTATHTNEILTAAKRLEGPTSR